MNFVCTPSIECFHSRGQHLCKFIGTKGSVCIRNEFNSHRIHWELVWDTNMAAVSLFWDTNMVAVTSCENTLYKSNDVSLLLRGFRPLSLTGWKNLGCCAKQGMYFRVFLSLTEKSNPRWLTYAQMVEYPPPPLPGIVMSVLREVRFWLVTRV